MKYNCIQQADVPDMSRRYRACCSNFRSVDFPHFRELASCEFSSAYLRSDADFGFEKWLVKQ
jgi:hypothetical protein